MIPIWAGKYLGLEFADKGRGPKQFDCWGLVCHVYKQEFNIELPSLIDEYKDHMAADEIAPLIDIEADHWYQVDIPSVGDAIVLRWTYRPMHVGIVVDTDKFLHCDNGLKQSVIESWKAPNWKRRVVGFYRHKERAA